LGKELRPRFTEVDSVFAFRLGEDSAIITITPGREPTSVKMCGVGLVGG
jgi:hypothetical protein